MKLDATVAPSKGSYVISEVMTTRWGSLSLETDDSVMCRPCRRPKTKQRAAVNAGSEVIKKLLHFTHEETRGIHTLCDGPVWHQQHVRCFNLAFGLVPWAKH